jgi:nucleoside-diphosphate-sugar epimerase
MLDGKGERIMNFVHRDDVAQALILLADKGHDGEIYNVNGGYASQREVYRSLGDYYDLPLPLATADAVPRKRGNTSKKVNSDKLKQLGWRPQYIDFLSLAFACDTV